VNAGESIDIIIICPKECTMSYNESIEKRITAITSKWKGTDAKKMFGGICHLLKGNMFCGVYRDYLILRLGEKGAAEALQSPHARPFDITGKPMKGWVMIDQQGFPDSDALLALLEEARDFARTLPPK
jgi:TfoX/Sxy family transcriptional regulator of competence genes